MTNNLNFKDMNTYSSFNNAYRANEIQCTCDRCGGTGYLPQSRHIEGGICFKCRGAKTITRYQRVPVRVLRTI